MDIIRLILSYIFHYTLVIPSKFLFNVVKEGLKSILTKILYIIIILSLIFCFGVYMYNKTFDKKERETITEIVETTQEVKTTIEDIKSQLEIERKKIRDEIEQNDYEYEQANQLYNDTIGKLQQIQFDKSININNSFAEINKELENIKTKFALTDVYIQKINEMHDKYDNSGMTYKGMYQNELSVLNTKAYNLLDENLALLDRMKYLEKISTVEGKLETLKRTTVVNHNYKKIIGENSSSFFKLDYEEFKNKMTNIEIVKMSEKQQHINFEEVERKYVKHGLESLYFELSNIVFNLNEKYELTQSDLDKFYIKGVNSFNKDTNEFIKFKDKEFITYIDYDNNTIYYNIDKILEVNEEEIKNNIKVNGSTYDNKYHSGYVKYTEEEKIRNEIVDAFKLKGRTSYEDLLKSIEKTYEHYILVTIVKANLDKEGYLE